MPFNPALLASIFTEERLRIWRELHRSGIGSVSALAARLHRDVSRVRHDLKFWQAEGLVELSRDGRRVTPRASADGILVAGPEAA